MDIARDRPADGDISRAGSDRDEQAPGDDHPQQRVDRAAGLHSDAATQLVELDDAVERGAVEDRAAGALGGVAVRTTQAAGQVVTGLAQIGRDVLDPLRVDDPGS